MTDQYWKENGKAAFIIYLLILSSQLMKNQSEPEYMLDQQEIGSILSNNNPNKEEQLNYRQEYYNLLGPQQKIKHSQLVQQLKLHDIQYNRLEDHNQFYIRLLHHSKNYRALTIKVILGPFTTVLTIFNDRSPSPIHELNSNCLYGCFGNVYLLQWGSEQRIAVKCIQFEQNHAPIFLKTIKEYTINKIASALKVGPKILKIQQFDLIAYQKCIQFCMEKCYLAEEYTLNQQDHLILREKLKILHELRIVHCDIKPSNIVYSQSYKSPVFLDYGFSKILSTELGTPIQTKFVGSLETCCKQMVQLYIKKQVGFIDFYYNDAYALNASSKSDPIRETGNDLQEIVKFIDPTIENIHYMKIFFSLYNDQIFNATSELLITRNNDRKFKIMNFLDMLAPTENLREFYFKFFEPEWKDSFQFSQIVRTYNHSHRHQLQLNFRQSLDYKLADLRPAPSIFCNLIETLFNIRLSLYQLDNDMIDFRQGCIGYTKFTNNSFSLEEKFDFVISHVGILNENHFIAQRNFEQSWEICNLFISSLQDNQQMGNGQEKLLTCFQSLTKYCLDAPLNAWKIRTFKRAISEEMIVKKISYCEFERYFIEIIRQKCQIEDKMKLLIYLISSLTYQIAVWGNSLINQKEQQEIVEQKMQKIRDLYKKLTPDEDQYMERLVKFDYFLIKRLLMKKNTLDSVKSIEEQSINLKEKDRKPRNSILKFIKVMYYYDLLQFEQCRLQIQRTFARSEIPIILKPEYFLLCNVYYNLNNVKRSKQIFSFFEENIMADEIIYKNSNIKIAQQVISQRIPFIQKFEIDQMKKPHRYLPLILKKYFNIKNATKLQQQQKFHTIIQNITKDDELVQCLKRLSQDRRSLEDKIKVFESVLRYFQRVLDSCDQQQREFIRQKYIMKLVIKIFWLKDQYSFIVQSFEKGKIAKFSCIFTVDSCPEIFDYLTKAYLMLNKTQKIKKLIRQIDDTYANKLMLVQKWIGTITFIVLFQSKLQKQKCQWAEFRQFLLIIVDFIDIHSTQRYIHSYINCVRYALSQRIEITQIDSGLQTILFPKYQWKYPLLSFFHLEALIKMVAIQNYLNQSQLRMYLWRISQFFPFLRHAQLKWIMQEYYNIVLKLRQEERFKRFVLRHCRKLINYYAGFKRNSYYICRIRLLENSNLMEIILEKQMALDGYIAEQEGVLLSYFNDSGASLQKWREKLVSYHRNANNLSVQLILRSHSELMRLRLGEPRES